MTRIDRFGKMKAVHAGLVLDGHDSEPAEFDRRSGIRNTAFANSLPGQAGTIITLSRNRTQQKGLQQWV